MSLGHVSADVGINKNGSGVAKVGGEGRGVNSMDGWHLEEYMETFFQSTGSSTPAKYLDSFNFRPVAFKPTVYTILLIQSIALYYKLIFQFRTTYI